MGKRTHYVAGTFSWVDLATSDADAAKTFYSTLFGWDVDDSDAGDIPYTFFRIDGDAICGLMPLTDAMREGGMPPTWTSYVTVDDADAVAARALELGGTTLGPAVDVLDAGRMAVLSDPQSAVFAVWQPRARIGAERVNDVGCLSMNELATTDLASARSFYESLFGWTTEAVDTGPDGPDIISVVNRGTLNANMSIVAGGAPPHWRPYFTVESTAVSLARAQELGGTAVFGPFPLPDGSMALALDGEGALFGLFEGPTDP